MTAAFRPFDPFQVFFDLDGNLASGGSLNFYNAGTTTPANVYGDQALSVNNGSSIAIGTDGRPMHDIWGNQSYRSRLYASDGTLVSDRDNISIPGGSTTIPTLISGDFLTNDGSVLEWLSLLQIPDPTGNANKILSTDGSVLNWIAQSAISNSGQTITLGPVIIQTGSGTVPASNATTATKSFTFPTPFSTLWHVEASMNTGSDLTALGYLPNFSVNGRSVNGATVNLDTNGAGSGSVITSTTDFTYFAIGLA